MKTIQINKLEQLRQRLDRYRAGLKRHERELAELQESLNDVAGAGGRGAGSSRGMARTSEKASSRLLIKAALGANLQAVRAQLSAGADPNSRDRDGDPVLHLAVLRDGNLSVVRELLKAGAEVDARNESGGTPLIACVRDENLAVVKELVSHGANVNERDQQGDTPLTNAACWGSRNVVKHLLAHGADPDLADGLNVSPSDLARQQGHDAIANLLDRASGRAGIKK